MRPIPVTIEDHLRELAKNVKGLMAEVRVLQATDSSSNNVDVQTWIASGTADADGKWIKPSGAKIVVVDYCCGGNGGGSGYGGNGGASGTLRFLASDLSDEENVKAGGGGLGIYPSAGHEGGLSYIRSANMMRMYALGFPGGDGGNPGMAGKVAGSGGGGGTGASGGGVSSDGLLPGGGGTGTFPGSNYGGGGGGGGGNGAPGYLVVTSYM